ncbi:MAG: ABC transporter substrate-binding protein [Syntrophales bacterium]|nr:ABC transporter substrate-binding protein [Syntrophales bacterium]
MVLISATFCGCQKKERTFHIGVLQWTEKIDSFNRTYQGVIDGLEAKGYREGMNLIVGYKNAEQDKESALRIAGDFVRRDVDLIVSLGTGSSLAALKATEEKRIPIVYSIVAEPKATGIIKDYDYSGKNITGVTMKIPVKEQFEVVKEVFPQPMRLGILYCTEMPQAIAAGREAAADAPEFGWTPLTVSFPKEDLPQLQDIVESLAEQVDAIYLPPDPVTSSPANRQTVIRVADEHKTPLIVAEGKFVEEGALMAVHCDFYDIGRQASGLIAQVLAGVDVRKIPSQKPVITRLSLNLKKAQQLNIKVKRNVILKADTLFD